VRGLLDRADEIRADRSGQRRRLAQLLPALVPEFGDCKSAEEIRACVDAMLSEFDDVPVRSFVLTRAERHIRDCLRQPECAALALAATAGPAASRSVVPRTQKRAGADAVRGAVSDRVSAINDESASGSRRRISMDCFECARVNDTVAAVGVCRHCGVGLCLDHLIESHAFTVAGTHYACSHRIPRAKPLRGMPAGIAASARHHTAAGV
jgi:hypothetical protein